MSTDTTRKALNLYFDASNDRRATQRDLDRCAIALYDIWHTDDIDAAHAIIERLQITVMGENLSERSPAA